MRSSLSSPATPRAFLSTDTPPAATTPTLRNEVVAPVLRFLPRPDRAGLTHALRSSNRLQQAALLAVVEELRRDDMTAPADRDLPAALLSALASGLARVQDDQQRNPQLVALLNACERMPPHQQDQIMAALLSSAAGSDVGNQAVLLDLVAAHLDGIIARPDRLAALLGALAQQLPQLHPSVQGQAARLLGQRHAEVRQEPGHYRALLRSMEPVLPRLSAPVRQDIEGALAQQQHRRQQVFARANLGAILEHARPADRLSLLETVAGPRHDRQLQMLLDDFPTDSQVARNILASSAALQEAALQDAEPEIGLRRAVAVLAVARRFGHPLAPQRAVDRIIQHWPACTDLPLPQRTALLKTLAGTLQKAPDQASWQDLLDKIRSALDSRDAQGVPTFSTAQRDSIMAALLRNLTDSAQPKLAPDLLRSRHAAIFDQFVHEFDRTQDDTQRLRMLTELSESLFGFHPDVQRRAWPLMATGLAALSTESERETAALWLENLGRNLHRVSDQAPQPAGPTLQQEVMQTMMTSAERFAEPARFQLRMLNAIAYRSLADPLVSTLPPALRRQVLAMMHQHLNAVDVPARERVAPLVTMLRNMPNQLHRIELLAEVGRAIDQVRGSDPEAFALLQAARLPHAPYVAGLGRNADSHFSREIEHGVNQLVGNPATLRELIGAVFDSHRTLAGSGWTIAMGVVDGAMRAVETGVARDRSGMSAAEAARDLEQWERAHAMVVQAQETLPEAWRRNLAIYRPAR